MFRRKSSQTSSFEEKGPSSDPEAALKELARQGYVEKKGKK